MAVYKTLYDVGATSPVNWQTLFWGLGFVLIGITYFVSHLKKPPTDRPRWFPAAWLGFAILWTVVGVGLPYHNNVTHAAALRDGTASVVEGPIQHFRTQSDCKDESFTVRGHAFEYSYYEDMGRFHFPQPCGGPIRAGMYVRITYVDDDDIIKVEQRTAKSP